MPRQVIPQHSVLIFCPTKRQTEVCAKTLSVALPPASPDLRYLPPNTNYAAHHLVTHR